jgi:hypothetical protein
MSPKPKIETTATFAKRGNLTLSDLQAFLDGTESWPRDTELSIAHRESGFRSGGATEVTITAIQPGPVS